MNRTTGLKKKQGVKLVPKISNKNFMKLIQDHKLILTIPIKLLNKRESVKLVVLISEVLFQISIGNLRNK